MTKPSKIILYSIYIIFVTEIFARSISYFMGYGFSTDYDRFISPFFTGTDMPYPILKDSTGIFVGNHEVAYSKEDNEIRIVFIGGSTTQNSSNAQKLKYSSEVQQYFNADFSNQKITVLNAGIAGFSSAHSLINLSLRIIEFQPDLVIIHHNINDRTVNIIGNKPFPDYSNKYLSDFFLGYEHRKGFSGFLLRNFKSVRILMWSSRFIRSVLVDTKHKEIDYKNIELAKKYFKRNLESIIAICDKHNILPLLLNQPAKNLSENLIHQDYNNIIKNVSHQNNIYFIDIATLISQKEDYFIDEVHYTSSGIKAIADFIYPVIVEVLKKENIIH